MLSLLEGRKSKQTKPYSKAWIKWAMPFLWNSYFWKCKNRILRKFLAQLVNLSSFLEAVLFVLLSCADYKKIRKYRRAKQWKEYTYDHSAGITSHMPFGFFPTPFKKCNRIIHTVSFPVVLIFMKIFSCHWYMSATFLKIFLQSCSYLSTYIVRIFTNLSYLKQEMNIFATPGKVNDATPLASTF